MEQVIMEAGICQEKATTDTLPAHSHRCRLLNESQVIKKRAEFMDVDWNNNGMKGNKTITVNIRERQPFLANAQLL